MLVNSYQTWYISYMASTSTNQSPSTGPTLSVNFYKSHCTRSFYAGGPCNGSVAWFYQEVGQDTRGRFKNGEEPNEMIEELQMKKQNIGSSFDDFLAEEAMLEEVAAVAVKRVIAWQIEQAMKQKKFNKTVMAEKMHTSRAALNRLLDQNDTSLTLTTLTGAAAALGKKLKFELVPA